MASVSFCHHLMSVVSICTCHTCTSNFFLKNTEQETKLSVMFHMSPRTSIVSLVDWFIVFNRTLKSLIGQSFKNDFSRTEGVKNNPSLSDLYPELPDYRTIGPAGCRTIELSDYRTDGLTGCRTNGLSDGLYNSYAPHYIYSVESTHVSCWTSSSLAKGYDPLLFSPPLAD